MDTIVALATPPMKSALAIIRVSGDDTFDIVSKIFSKPMKCEGSRGLLVGKIMDNDLHIDDVVMAIYKHPHSFTGEDSVEIMCHGSVLIANQIIELLIKHGARMATNGEYSERAYMNNKIDLVQAEAINDVINSISKEAKALSMYSLDGKTSTFVKDVKTKITDILALIEVNIDYPEYEDIEVANREYIIEKCTAIIKDIENLIKDGEKAKIIKEGIKVAIVGKPNVGKSSLLNALLGEEKAIVTSIAGTTRDVVEGDVNLNGITLHLLDTAGIRNSEDVVENIGVNKSKEMISKADLVIVVLDSNKLEKEDEEVLEISKGYNRIIVYNKADLISKNNPGAIYISALNHDIEPLKNAIYQMYGISEETFSRPALNNARQLGLLKQAYNALLDAIRDAENGLSIDLVDVNLWAAYNALCYILGENLDPDFSKEIFKRFCVGK